MKYPSKARLKEMEKKLAHVEGAKGLPMNATAIQKLKYDLCKEIVTYIVQHRINQKDLADELGVDPAIVSKIINYNIEYFSVDKLGEYVAILNPKVEFKVS